MKVLIATANATALKPDDQKTKARKKSRACLASSNRVRLDLRTTLVRDYGAPRGIPTLVEAPRSGHTAMIADYREGRSLIETLLANGINHVALTDWKSATEDMKDLEIDNYLAEMIVAIEDLGGLVNLIGLSQGGWMAAMLAARFPNKVNSMVLVGSPIDTDTGDGPIKRMAHELPMSFYKELVALGGGLMKGEFMLDGWKKLQLEQGFVEGESQGIEFDDRFESELACFKDERFESWYENPVDLPGRWYLQVVRELFKENRLTKGTFVGLGRHLDLRDITCPVYLLAGASDIIVPWEQVFATEKYLGTPTSKIQKRLVPTGHIGLFIGELALREAWPAIARWVRDH
jgi:poly(3-hydroxyalkanoate) synthetase